MRLAKSVLVAESVKTYTNLEGVHVDAFHPAGPVTENYLIHPIPRRSPSPTPLPNIHRFSKKKAIILAEKVAKAKVKKNKKFPARYKGFIHFIK